MAVKDGIIANAEIGARDIGAEQIIYDNQFVYPYRLAVGQGAEIWFEEPARSLWFAYVGAKTAEKG